VVCGGEGWKGAVHVPSCVEYVTKELLIFVKRTQLGSAAGIHGTGYRLREAYVGKVREQLADLEQSSLRNDIFWGACSHLSSECLKRTHRFVH